MVNLRKLFHLCGLLSLSGVVALEIFIFYNMTVFGYIYGVEPNKVALALEWFVLILSVFYLTILIHKYYRGKLHEN